MLRSVALVSACLLIATSASGEERRNGGKLLLTDGVSSVEGAAGGGLAAWATIAGNETEDGIGGTAHATYVALPDFDLSSAGAAVGLSDRVEFSYAYQRFDTRSAGAALGLGRGFTFGQHIAGAKVKLIGDAVWDQDRVLPQIVAGVQYKIAERGAIIRAGGRRGASISTSPRPRSGWPRAWSSTRPPASPRRTSSDCSASGVTPTATAACRSRDRRANSSRAAC
jgi:hypothetical protein